MCLAGGYNYIVGTPEQPLKVTVEGLRILGRLIARAYMAERLAAPEPSEDESQSTRDAELSRSVNWQQDEDEERGESKRLQKPQGDALGPQDDLGSGDHGRATF